MTTDANNKGEKQMKKKYCVVQYYRVELVVEADDREDAKNMITDDDRNFYTITANMDNADNDVQSLSVWATDMDTEVYEDSYGIRAGDDK